MNVVNVEFMETSSQIGWDDSRRKSKFSIYYSGQFNFTTLSDFIKVPAQYLNCRKLIRYIYKPIKLIK